MPNLPRFPPPRRRQPPKASPEQQVEVEKLDAESFLKQGAETERVRQPPRDIEAEMMANAVPIDVTNVTATPTPAPPTEEKQEIKPPPPPQPEDPLDRILPASLVERLSERFGLKPNEELVERVLTASGKEVKISFRKPLYDDWIWALGEIESRVSYGQDLSLLRTEQQRDSYLKHLSRCRAVLKIEDEWIWDGFGATEVIFQAVPEWNGENHHLVPDLILSDLAHNVHNLFRHLHYDLLFALNAAVRDAFPDIEPKDEKEDEKTEESEDPSDAA